MTASPFPPSPPRARLPLAAIGLTCCLLVYVIVVPLLRGGTGWKLAVVITAGAAVTVAVLVLLFLIRAAAATAIGAQAATDGEISRLRAQVQEQAAELSTRSAELSTQSERLAEERQAHERLRSECADLRASNDKLREQIATEVADQQESTRAAVVALARRVQASAHRIQEEATLMAERHPGDADVLEVSMRVDHAAAQQARNAQSMAVLCGEWPGQQWPEPLPLVDVVRAAAGRIIAYRRIEVAGDPDIAAAAPVVEPLIHLVAELLANATQSSPPATEVPVTVRSVQRGAVIEVHDCGVGLDDYRLTRAREIASGQHPVGLADLGEFPQTGLAVIGQYVRRHGFRVDVSESVYGGVRAVVGVPAELVETVEPAEMTSAPAHAAATIPGSATVPSARVAAPSAPSAPSATPAPPVARCAPASPASPVAPAGTSGPGLPRRHSPRHDAAAEPVAAARPAGATSPAEEPPTPEPPTPEQAGAWMGAFLRTTDNSATQQEQQ